MGRDDANSRNGAALAGRNPRHLQPSVPAWDQVRPPLPWWETVSPTPASGRRIQLEISSDIQPTSSPEGETGMTGERGWAPMKRILIALAGLAALFLAAGANSRWG
jgi:hypothetical protein